MLCCTQCYWQNRVVVVVTFTPDWNQAKWATSYDDEQPLWLLNAWIALLLSSPFICCCFSLDDSSDFQQVSLSLLLLFVLFWVFWNSRTGGRVMGCGILLLTSWFRRHVGRFEEEEEQMWDACEGGERGGGGYNTSRVMQASLLPESWKWSWVTNFQKKMAGCWIAAGAKGLMGACRCVLHLGFAIASLKR